MSFAPPPYEVILFMLQLMTWQPTTPPILHQGHWQSCDHQERVLEHQFKGLIKWELHLGPDDEFALFTSFKDGLDDDHASKENLLGPAFKYGSLASRTGRNWTIPSLKLRLNVIQGGGSRDECLPFSYYIKVESTARLK